MNIQYVNISYYMSYASHIFFYGQVLVVKSLLINTTVNAVKYYWKIA